MACVVTGCGSPADRAAVPGAAIEMSVNARDRVAHARVFFAHQSVGDNIVEGLKALQTPGEGEALHIVDLKDAASTPGPAFIHARLGENGHPGGKTDAFAAALDAGLGNSVDIALQKYCFADFDANTDVMKVFKYYKQASERIQARYPALMLLHATAPLMSVQSGPRAIVKKWIGRVPDYYPENAVRERFNHLMRQQYAGGGHLFDLAAIEASAPGRPPKPILFKGQTLYTLLPEYTTDGGHLNAAAQQRVASEFLSFLASFVKDGPAHSSVTTVERASGQ